MRPFIPILCATLCTAVVARNKGPGRSHYSIVLREVDLPTITPFLKQTSLESKHFDPLRLPSRGGATADDSSVDSNRVVAAKTLLSAAIETAGMMGLFRLAEEASPTVTKWLDKLNIAGSILELPILQWMSSIFVIFGSGSINSWLKGGMGAATKQVVKPNVVPGDTEWYTSLEKPWFNPPGWVFPIMWLLISKPTQLIAVSKILKNSPTPYWPALTVYCAHLSLGDAWNDVFFGSKRVGLGVVVISTFFGMLLTSAKLFADVDKAAGKFMLPTCGWVFVATSLNWSIYFKNRE